jgi:ubiquinone/menaquinone biosynthesis C-methylase UbiE
MTFPVMQPEIEFEKYQKRGAYHWDQYFGSVLKIDSFLRGRYQLLIHLLRTAGIKSSSSLLEVGCGDGALSGLIYQTFNCEITGVDPSADGIRYSEEMFQKHQFQGSFHVSEGYHLSFPDHRFDFIVLADVIEHLQHPGLMLQELRRLTKPGGYILITTPIRCSEFPEDTMHVREFYQEELIALCHPFFGTPVRKVYSHPAVWHELYSFGKKSNRSLVRLYCRMVDKILGRNVFFRPNSKQQWKNFRQQGLLFNIAT